MKPADWAWAALAASVLGYEALASRRRHDWELLSEACDRYRTRHPVVVNCAIAYLAAHLARLIPKPIDPLHRMAARLGR